jgi:adenine-specific DNA methylase
MEKLRGNDEELQIKINAQMQANADEQAQLLQQSREQEQRMEELRGSTEELRQETARLQGHEQQLQAHNIMLASLLQEMEKLRGNEVEHMDAAHRLEAQHKAIIQNIQELHGNETLLNKKIRALKEELQGTIGHRLDRATL